MHKNGTKKVTRRFNSLYHKTKATLTEKDCVKKTLLSKFTKIKYMHLSEHNFLQLLNAEYAKAIGNYAMQLTHLTKIKIATDDKNTAYELSLLAQRFVLELQLNKLKNAYDTYKSIEKISVAKPYLAHYQALIKQVDKFIHSEK
jgi:hypothetical protein